MISKGVTNIKKKGVNILFSNGLNVYQISKITSISEHDVRGIISEFIAQGDHNKINMSASRIKIKNTKTLDNELIKSIVDLKNDQLKNVQIANKLKIPLKIVDKVLGRLRRGVLKIEEIADKEELGVDVLYRLANQPPETIQIKSDSKHRKKKPRVNIFINSSNKLLHHSELIVNFGEKVVYIENTDFGFDNEPCKLSKDRTLPLLSVPNDNPIFGTFKISERSTNERLIIDLK